MTLTGTANCGELSVHALGVQFVQSRVIVAVALPRAGVAARYRGGVCKRPTASRRRGAADHVSFETRARWHGGHAEDEALIRRRTTD